MLEKTEAIVLKSTKFGDSSLIVKVFTEKFGIIPLILKGIRSAKKSHSGLFQAAYLLDLSIYYRENKQLFQVKEYNIHYGYQSIAQNFSKQSIALFLVELLLNSLREQHINKEIFSYAKDFLLRLDNEKQRLEYYPLNLLFELSQHLGIEPLNNKNNTDVYFNLEKGIFEKDLDVYTCLDIESSTLLHQFILNYSNQIENRFNAEERNALLNSWLKYYNYHVPEFRPMQTPQILREILH